MKGKHLHKRMIQKRQQLEKMAKLDIEVEVMAEVEIEEDPIGKLSNGNLLMIKEVIKMVFNATTARSLGM